MDSTNGIFDIPFAPVSSISSVTIDGTATTNYTMIGLDNETMELDAGDSEKVKVTYVTSGLDDSLLIQAILQLTATYYDNRSDVFEGSSRFGNVEIPTSVKNILSSYRTMFI